MSSFPPRKTDSKRFGTVSRMRAVRRNRIAREYHSPTLIALSWLDDAAGLFFTSPGKMLLIAFLPIAFFSLLLTRSPAFLLFLLLLFVFLLDLLGKIFFPRRLRIERILPARTVRGVPFEIRTKIRNESFLPACDFTVNRNLEPVLSRQEKNAPLYCLPGHSEMLIRQSYRLDRRGIYDLPPAAAEGVFPFRLVKAVRRSTVRQELICHPDYADFRSLRLPGGNRISDRNSVNLTRRTGESLDFLGCREYRSGDDTRKIHWTASARRNRLVVKEFQEEQFSSAAIILDNYCPSAAGMMRNSLKQMIALKSVGSGGFLDQTFEAAVSLTASIAHSLSSRNFVIDVFASGSEIHHFRTGRNTMSFEAFLDVLASLNCTCSEMRFDHLPVSELNRAAAAGAVFLILSHIDSESEKIYKALLQRGANLRVFLLDGEGPLPDWAEGLTSREILENRRREL